MIPISNLGLMVGGPSPKNCFFFVFFRLGLDFGSDLVGTGDTDLDLGLTIDLEPFQWCLYSIVIMSIQVYVK